MQIETDPWVIFLLTLGMDIEKNPGPSHVTRNITICNLNIRSLTAKPRTVGTIPRFTAFKNALAGTYDIITATESWLTSEHHDLDLVIPNYNGPYRYDRPDDSGHGGEVAWVSDALISKHRPDIQVLNHESLWIEVGTKDAKVLVGISYRQELGDFSAGYWPNLQSGYDKAVATRIPNIILVGDFNADPDNKGAHDNLVEFLGLNNLTQHINEPTRLTDRKSSKLDLIISNLPMLVLGAGVGTPVHENDHCTIFGTLNLKTIKRGVFTREMWNFKNADFDLFREELGNVRWEDCFVTDDIDEICDTWTSMFKAVSEKVISKKRVKIRPNDKNWYNNYLRNLRIVKDRDYKTWAKAKCDLNWVIYKESRNKYFQECDRIKIEHEEHIYANLATEINNNPKRWWSLVGQTMGTSKKSNYPVMIKGGVIYSTDKEKAEAFNETYLESANMAGDLYDVPFEDIIPDHEVLDEIKITERDVADVIKCINTNKAYGPDDVSPRLIKEAGHSIVNILTKIFNKSLQLAKFPLAWKRANVLPIYKKAETFITTNYRPVSLLSILSKIFEKIVFKYLYNYFRDHFMISVWQSGFLPGSSTVTQLTEIYDQFCKAVGKGMEIRVVFLDISKAFDRVWHKGLLYKLKSCGITGKLLEWLKDYLTDRQQRVIVNGEHSEWGRINAGVPQGSVLGPLLFLIFINDITHVIRNCKIRLFADDTCLFIEVEDPDTAASALNEDLERLNGWANKWHVTFSPPKTEEVVISRKRDKIVHSQVFLDGEPIKQVAQHKHLGLIISQDLLWGEHINEICDKANRRLGILRSLKYKLDRLSLERIYMGFIRPLLEYGDIIWDKSPQEILNKLETVQLNAARIVVGATARCSTEGLYAETAWEPLYKRRESHRLTLMYQIVHGAAPQYLIDLLPDQVQGRTTYNLRNRGDIDEPLVGINLHGNSFFPSTVKLWNNLDRAKKSLPSVESFKASHKRSLPSKNPLYFFGGRLENAIHARMRIGNSPLKADLSDVLHVIQSPLCPCGGGVSETARHFFFECPLYDIHRATLRANLLPLLVSARNHDYLLFGIPNSDHVTNLKVFGAVHQYIRETKRFY
jgi:hypothetical protein